MSQLALKHALFLAQFAHPRAKALGMASLARIWFSTIVDSLDALLAIAF